MTPNAVPFKALQGQVLKFEQPGLVLHLDQVWCTVVSYCCMGE